MPATREKVESTAQAEAAVGTPPGRLGKPAEAPRPRRLGLALAVIAAAQLMVMLDGTIVNVALPHIQTALHFSGTNLEWVVNAYTLAWSAVASNTKSAIAATHGAHLSALAQTALGNHALAYGFGRGYLASAGISILAVLIAVVMIRVKKADLEGIDPMAAGTAQPGSYRTVSAQKPAPTVTGIPS